MRVKKLGYGMGKKDFEAANCVRAFWGEDKRSAAGPNGTVAELSCNLDDMTGEAIGFACQRLLKAGAKDVFTVPVQMKKGRPGVLLICVCAETEADAFAALLLQYTTTFGVRKASLSRYTLERQMDTLQTPWGEVRVKKGKGYGVEKSKLEYEDVAKAAQKYGKSVSELEQQIWQQMGQGEEA